MARTLDWPFVAVVDVHGRSFDSRNLYTNSRDAGHGYLHARAMDSGYLNDDGAEIAVGQAEIIVRQANSVSRKLPAGQPGFDLSLDPGAIGFQPG